MRPRGSWVRVRRCAAAIIATAVGAGLLATGGNAQVLQGGLPQLPALPVTPPSLPGVPAPPGVVPAPLPVPVPSPPAQLPSPGAPLPAPRVPLPAPGASLPAPGTPSAPAGSAPASAPPSPTTIGSTAGVLVGGLAGGNRASGGTPASAGGGAGAGRAQSPGVAERRRWDTPLRGPRLRRLRNRLLESWSCAGTLPTTTRRVLLMRAGLFGRTPATRRTIARRIGITLGRTLRMERLGVRRLTRAGMCIDAGGAALGTNLPSVAAGGSAVGGSVAGASRDSTGARHHKPDQQGVLGVSESSGPLAHPSRAEERGSRLNTLLGFLAV